MTDPSRLLELAREMLGNAEPATAGLWPRAAALLGRQALEISIAEIWRRRQPQMLGCSARAQFLALTEIADIGSLASRARYAWTTLSRACHHHAYELSPTDAELISWLNDTEIVVQAASAVGNVRG